jgi:hypothetical protein
MSRKLISAQSPFTLLVANLRRGSDPSRGEAGNPDPVRQTYTFQHFPEIGGRGPEVGTVNPRTPGVGTRIGHVDYTTPPVPVLATGTVTVAVNTFAGPTTVQVGQYVLTTGIDFDVGGSLAATATNLAAAIDALPGYSAPAPGAAIVTVTGPAGVAGNEVVFASSGASPQNFTFNPIDGTMDGAEPIQGPPILG